MHTDPQPPKHSTMKPGSGLLDDGRLQVAVARLIYALIPGERTGMSMRRLHGHVFVTTRGASVLGKGATR